MAHSLIGTRFDQPCPSIKHLEGRDIERSEIVCSAAASARGPSHEAHHVTVRRRAIHHGVLSAAGNLSRQAQRIDGRQP